MSHRSTPAVRASSLLAALSLAGGTALLGGCSMSEMRASKGDPNAQFLTETAHDSHSEIALSQLAAERASDPRVKQYAQMMISDHQQQNQQLMQVAQSKGASVPARPDEAHAKTAANMRNLSGAEFDREYMSHMVADHAKLLSIVEDKAATAQDPEVRSFAQAQVPVLRTHLEQARQINRSLGGASDVGSAGTAGGANTAGYHSGGTSTPSGSR